MPFFSDFSRKNNCSNAHILSKNRPFSENNLLLSPYYVKKRIFSQKPNCSHIIIIKFFIKTPSVNAHIWSKNVNSVKNSHYGPKKSIGCPFLPFFHEKLLPNAHIYFQKEKRPFTKNTLLSWPFCRKNVHCRRLCAWNGFLSPLRQINAGLRAALQKGSFVFGGGSFITPNKFVNFSQTRQQSLGTSHALLNHCQRLYIS